MIKCNWTNLSLRKLISALTPNSLKHQMTDNLGLVDGSNHQFIKWQPRSVVRNRTWYISRARKKFTCGKLNNSFYSDHFGCLLGGLWKYFDTELCVFMKVKITFIDVLKKRKSSWRRKINLARDLRVTRMIRFCDSSKNEMNAASKCTSQLAQ